MQGRWLIFVILCVLGSLLVPEIASAGTDAGTQHSVLAFDFAERVSAAGAHRKNLNVV